LAELEGDADGLAGIPGLDLNYIRENPDQQWDWVVQVLARDQARRAQQRLERNARDAQQRDVELAGLERERGAAYGRATSAGPMRAGGLAMSAGVPRAYASGPCARREELSAESRNAARDAQLQRNAELARLERNARDAQQRDVEFAGLEGERGAAYSRATSAGPMRAGRLAMSAGVPRAYASGPRARREELSAELRNAARDAQLQRNAELARLERNARDAQQRDVELPGLEGERGVAYGRAASAGPMRAGVPPAYASGPRAMREGWSNELRAERDAYVARRIQESVTAAQTDYEALASRATVEGHAPQAPHATPFWPRLQDRIVDNVAANVKTPAYREAESESKETRSAKQRRINGSNLSRSAPAMESHKAQQIDFISLRPSYKSPKAQAN
jgi:hypothetical protein